MIDAILDELRAVVTGAVKVDEPMSGHTTWRIGGPADLFIEPLDRKELRRAIALLNRRRVPWLAVGAGSNLLVRDGGIRGAVLHLRHFRHLEIEATGRVMAGGGLPLMTLIRATTEQGLAGLEALAGIPGTVGGGIAMNAGAGGQQLADVVKSVTLVGATGEEHWDRERLQFGYRHSALNGERVLVEADMLFRRENTEKLAEIVQQKLAQRRDSQRVGGPNAGSVFKNPSIRPAWKLIDEAGMRGAMAGAARVAERHANFIVNTGNATAQDVIELIERIREKVRQASGIELEPEVRIVGEDRRPLSCKGRL